MVIVTNIEIQKKDKNRVSVYLDGEFFRGMDSFALAQSRIKIGDEVNERELENLIFSSDIRTAFDKALKQIEYRTRAKNELILFLQKKGYDNKVIYEVIEKLTEYGYCNDERFCEEYIKSYSRRYGKIKIKADLKNLGIDEEIIENAIACIDEQADQAYALACKYIKGKKNITPIKVRAYLIRHGYTYDDVSLALENLTDDGAFGEEEND